MYDTIINAVNNSIQSIPNSPTLFVENMEGTPQLRNPWIRTTLIPSEPIQVSRGSSRLLQYTSLMQIDYFVPKGSNSTPSMVDEIVSHFNAVENRLLEDSMQVMVLRAWRGTGTTEQNWYRVPIMIRMQWYAE